MGMGQNLVPLVNIKIAGKWMFIPLKMVLIGIDPYPYLWLTRVVKKFVVHRRTMYWHPITYDPVWENERARDSHTCFSVNAQWNTNYSFITMVKTWRNHEPICGVSTLVQHLQKSGIHPRYQILVPWCPLMSRPHLPKASLGPGLPKHRRRRTRQGLRWCRKRRRLRRPAAGSCDGAATCRTPETETNSPGTRQKKVWKSVMNLGILLILYNLLYNM